MIHMSMALKDLYAGTTDNAFVVNALKTNYAVFPDFSDYTYVLALEASNFSARALTALLGFVYQRFTSFGRTRTDATTTHHQVFPNVEMYGFFFTSACGSG